MPVKAQSITEIISGKKNVGRKIRSGKLITR